MTTLFKMNKHVLHLKTWVNTERIMLSKKIQGVVRHIPFDTSYVKGHTQRYYLPLTATYKPM